MRNDIGTSFTPIFKKILGVMQLFFCPIKKCYFSNFLHCIPFLHLLYKLNNRLLLTMGRMHSNGYGLYYIL